MNPMNKIDVVIVSSTLDYDVRLLVICVSSKGPPIRRHDLAPLAVLLPRATVLSVEYARRSPPSMAFCASSRISRNSHARDRAHDPAHVLADVAVVRQSAALVPAVLGDTRVARDIPYLDEVPICTEPVFRGRW